MLQSRVPVLKFYYAATALFLLFDYLGGINIRLAFLAPWPVWRGLYYLACFACLGLIVWRPALTTLVTTAESLITLAALIVTMGVRVMTISESVLHGEGMAPTVEELTNFMIAGMAAWYGWFRGTMSLKKVFWH